jgi:DHA3 family macrolide efflux protein-like MFS transporter
MAAIIPLVFIRVPQPERIERRAAQNGDTTSVWQDFVEGLRYVKAWPGLMIIALMAICINFLITPAFSLLPLLVKEYFGGGALELGWVNSTAGIGIIIGGTLLSVWGGFKRKILTTFLGLTGMGIGILAIAFAPATSILWLVMPILIIGIMMPLTNGPIGAVMQSSVAPDMQARVSSLLNSVAGAMSPIGLMIAGPVSDSLGIQSWFILGGIICLVFAAVGPFIPAVINLGVKDLGELEVEANTISEVYAAD